MGIYSIKPWFVRRLRRVEDALVTRRVSPDALTALAVVASIAAGAAIAAGGMLGSPLWWLAVPPLVLVRLALNALDGQVARRTGRARPSGTALNEIGDRVSDAALIGATGFVVQPALATGALASSFLVSFTGVLALALTGRRDSAGPAGKADRAALVAAAATVAVLVGSALPFTIALWSIIAGGIATAAIRLVRTQRTLEAHAPRRELLVETIIEITAETPVDEEMLHVVCR